MRYEVNSSAIKSVEYLDEDLIVEFHKSGSYEYLNVPRRVFNELIDSKSKGQYYNQYIKNYYNFVKI